MGQVKREVEAAKRNLSAQHSVKIEVESFLEGPDLQYTLTRSEFEELNVDLFSKTMKAVEQVPKDARFHKAMVDDIV